MNENGVVIITPQPSEIKRMGSCYGSHSGGSSNNNSSFVKGLKCSQVQITSCYNKWCYGIRRRQHPWLIGEPKTVRTIEKKSKGKTQRVELLQGKKPSPLLQVLHNVLDLGLHILDLSHKNPNLLVMLRIFEALTR